ncbi:hypothetical protein EH31_10340 [Erythrobacter longus]|uniref:Uncharacterized protein n=1 Tax=Erythrobacter longus TaxID=1044 RepID=A0A074MXX2_ERYLO|nr:hypothetical protein EH31_10340 [Erythrobacter longus]
MLIPLIDPSLRELMPLKQSDQRTLCDHGPEPETKKALSRWRTHTKEAARLIAKHIAAALI